jgi:hypothetical protein
MAEMVTTQIVVGDKVRVHFHPPGLMKSFCEGVVRRVNVTTPEGHFFVVEVAHEVLLDREHRIRPGFEDYVRHECPNDFPGRIELLPTAEQDLEMYLASDLMIVDLLTEAEQEDDEPRSVEPEVHSEPEVERPSEVATDCELTQVDVEPQPVGRQSGLMAALFGRKR